jgi:inhibitor of KinA
MPGFAYLGGLPERIATPRRSSPRTAVPAGAVGIGGQQTGVYPVESPGGWNLIGRTPLQIFDITRDEQTLLATGDRVRFAPISLREFERWPSES